MQSKFCQIIAEKQTLIWMLIKYSVKNIVVISIAISNLVSASYILLT
jgi:hypothetical protein